MGGATVASITKGEGIGVGEGTTWKDVEEMVGGG